MGSLSPGTRLIIDQGETDFYQCIRTWINPLYGLRYVTTYEMNSCQSTPSNDDPGSGVAATPQSMDATTGRTGRSSSYWARTRTRGRGDVTPIAYTVNTMAARFSERYDIGSSDNPLYDPSTAATYGGGVDARGQLTVPEVLVRECERMTVAIADFIRTAHGVPLQRLQCEFVQDFGKRMMLHAIIDATLVPTPAVNTEPWPPAPQSSSATTTVSSKTTTAPLLEWDLNTDVRSDDGDEGDELLDGDANDAPQAMMDGLVATDSHSSIPNNNHTVPNSASAPYLSSPLSFSNKSRHAAVAAAAAIALQMIPPGTATVGSSAASSRASSRPGSAVSTTRSSISGSRPTSATMRSVTMNLPPRPPLGTSTSASTVSSSSSEAQSPSPPFSAAPITTTATTTAAPMHRGRVLRPSSATQQRSIVHASTAPGVLKPSSIAETREEIDDRMMRGRALPSERTDRGEFLIYHWRQAAREAGKEITKLHHQLHEKTEHWQKVEKQMISQMRHLEMKQNDVLIINGQLEAQVLELERTLTTLKGDHTHQRQRLEDQVNHLTTQVRIVRPIVSFHVPLCRFSFLLL
jgi:hypothetical protein